jgi:hypothetical protein
VWRARRKREFGRASLVDRRYVLLPTLISMIFFLVHATNLLLGR